VDHTKQLPADHRLIRRGIPYGPPLRSRAKGLSPEKEDRGLLFVAYMASIERQFEFLMRDWANNTGFPGAPSTTETGYDPMIGSVQDQPKAAREMLYTTQADPAAAIQGQPISLARFIKFRGGGYFFSPAIGHIQELAGS
jgi:deferrochelatase/peroxidase EfeB